jgi:hypothetical protein
MCIFGPLWMVSTRYGGIHSKMFDSATPPACCVPENPCCEAESCGGEEHPVFVGKFNGSLNAF